MRGYTLGSGSVAHCLRVTVTFTSGLNSLGAFVTFLVKNYHQQLVDREADKYILRRKSLVSIYVFS